MTATPPHRVSARVTVTLLVVAAAVFAALDLALYRAGQRTSGAYGPAAGLAAALLVDLCLPFAHRFPRAVAAVTIAVSAAVALARAVAPGLLSPQGPPLPGAVPMCTPVVVWFLAHRLSRRDALAGTAALAVLAAHPWTPGWQAVGSGLSATVLPAVLGLYVRARADLVASLRERAETAERERHLLAEHAKAAERERLAAEMHDVVTHHVTEIVLAAGALKISAPDTAVRSAAEQIREAGARTLTELRDLIGVLSRGDQAPPRQTAEPADLADAVRSTGEPVALHVSGDPAGISPAVARAARRVLQESLTNARKHAPGARVEVDIGYGRDSVSVAVRNDRPARPADPSLAASGSGLGLDGLRRRVTLLGGSFTAGPHPGGGFAVSATLPAAVPTERDSE
ncbi:sensor histidine kinase [Streptosporangium carneum]|uniref:histidine kinase n=1 Tax=Streptosporangium carneum TaxID=47481 RepID=A0A9W6MFY8_9ACTN|nr:ATP-binding protein [Streptosporangium carneum]GLK12550.1 two-component sensor histidine kinase [Streptosporangium carneum]